MAKRVLNWIKRLHRGEEGSFTVFGLYMSLGIAMIGGIALDIGNAYRVRTQLQVAGDAAAHAALVTREYNSEEDAIDKALEIAQGTMPPTVYGDVLRATDVYFGTWDDDTRSFSFDADSKSAVLVDTGRLTDRGNSVGTFLLRLSGVTSFNVRRSSVFITYKPSCLREGFVADEIVEVTSGNTYWAGFCIHSNALVSLNNNNVFQTGAIVSMPDIANLDIPEAGWESNEGLNDALRDGSYQLHIVNRIDEIIAGIQTVGSEYYRDWIDVTSSVDVSPSMNMDEEDFVAGRVNILDCSSGSGKAKIANSTVLDSVVIVTNCELAFGQGVGLEDTTIVNTNTSVDSFNSASSIVIGRDDGCAEGGGAQLVTLGGIKFPSDLSMYGGQMIAAGDVSFTANADGIQGASIVSGGRIDGTTNSNMAFCNGAGMEDNFEAWYFKLAL